MPEQIANSETIQKKRNTRANVVIIPSVKERIFDAISRQAPAYRVLRRLAKPCGGVEAIVDVLQEGIQDMQAQGVAPRFRNGFGKPMGKAVVAMRRREHLGEVA